MSRICFACIFLLVMTLSSCGGGSASIPESTGSFDDIPSLGSLTGDSRVVTATTFEFASDDMVGSQDALMSEGTLTLAEAPFSYALFKIGTEGGQPETLTLTGTCSGLWIAVSDCDRVCWNWIEGDCDTTGEITLPTNTVVDGHVYFALVCPEGSMAQIGLQMGVDTGNEGTWNFLVWIAGDNDLNEAAYADIQELEAVGSNDNINILCGYDIDPSHLTGKTGIDNVWFIRVVEDSNPSTIVTNGHAANQSFPRDGYDSADPAKLVQFVDWADTNFEADHTILVLWDHGDGWRDDSAAAGGSNGRLTRKAGRGGKSTAGVLSDYNDGGPMTSNAAIASALGTRTFDAIYFDACNMGHIEALYEYRGLAGRLVASEVLVPNDGFKYDTALDAWNEGFPLAIDGISQLFIDEFCKQYEEVEYCAHGNFGSGTINQLITALAGFASTVTAKANDEKAHVQAAITASFTPDSGDGVRDLKGFLQEYNSRTSDLTVKSRISAVMTPLNDTIEYYRHYDQEGSTGLAVWLPAGAGEFTTGLRNEYSGLAFNTATGWLDMLEACLEGGSGGEADWVPGDKIVFDWDNANFDIDLWAYDPDDNYTGPEEGGETTNLLFSGPSSGWGETDPVSIEWAQLKPGATQGVYYFDVVYFWWYGDGSPPATCNVHIQLLDSSDNLKQDFGNVTVVYDGSPVEVATLTY